MSVKNKQKGKENSQLELTVWIKCLTCFEKMNMCLCFWVSAGRRHRAAQVKRVAAKSKDWEMQRKGLHTLLCS